MYKKYRVYLKLPKMQTRPQVMTTLYALASSGRLVNNRMSARNLVERIANGRILPHRVPIPERMTITELFQNRDFMASLGTRRCLPMGIALYLQKLKDLCDRCIRVTPRTIGDAVRFQSMSDGSLVVYDNDKDAMYIDQQQNKYFTYDEEEDVRMQQKDGGDGLGYDYDVYYRYRCRKMNWD